ncbi:C-type lectin domain 6 member A [Mactra antiquata]
MFLLLLSFVGFGNYGHVTSHDVGVCHNGWTRYNDSCYFINLDQAMSFMDAENFCQQYNARLIHVETSAENQFIVDMLHRDQAGSCWVGLNDMDKEGKWLWYGTQTAPQFTYWWPHEPHGGDGEDCAVYYARHTNYNWDDYSCSHHFHPLCEFIPETVDVIG